MTANEAGPLVGRDAVAPRDRAALSSGAGVIVRPGLARFRLVGDGRTACLQGLVTCDVEQPGDGGRDGARMPGALLTTRGMIVAPLAVTRLADALIVEAPAVGAAAVATVFGRSLPPRLCRFEDVTEASRSIGAYGPQAADLLAAALGGALPAAPGQVASLPCGHGTAVVARVVADGLDGFECLVASDDAPALVADLAARGAHPLPPALLEERRILAGVPRLGAEIDDRTLPQEARLDALGAVSFTKGCYLGQETVARIHFRGHPNRWLAGLALEREPASVPLDVAAQDRPAGRLTSACWWESGHQWVGLAVLRRDVESGATVTLPDGAAARARELPWEPASGPEGQT